MLRIKNSFLHFVCLLSQLNSSYKNKTVNLLISMPNLKNPRKYLSFLVLLGYSFICDLLLTNTMAPLTAVHSPICKHTWRAVLIDNSTGMSADLSCPLAVKAVSQTSYIERWHYLDQRDTPRSQSEPNLYRCSIRHSDSSKSLKRSMWYNMNYACMYKQSCKCGAIHCRSSSSSLPLTYD